MLDGLFACKYFKLTRLLVRGMIPLVAERRSFHSLRFISGSGSVDYRGEQYGFSAGDSFFMPAGLGDYQIRGQAVCLLTTL